MTKEKLIQQYKEKIELCDNRLESIAKNKRELRHGKGPWDKEELIQDRKIESAQRQCYVQFVSDLEYELT